VHAKPLPAFDVDDMQRLLARIVINDNGCWIVQNVAENDYGAFRKDGQTYQAHRVTYQMFKGEVPIDQVVDHQCPGRPNRACVNPRHLAVTTHKQNIRNAYPKCKHGHEMRFPNVFELDGKRKCVACKLAKQTQERSKSRMVPGGTCSSGHLLTWQNVYEYVKKDGNRTVACRTCMLDRAKTRYSLQSLAKPLPQMTSVAQRSFLSMVKRNSDGCWEWQGAKKKGYGSYSFDGLSYPSHRIAYQLEYGKIDRLWDVDHLCCNRGCCNPAHLEPVTREENMMRARKRKPAFNKSTSRPKPPKLSKPLFTPPDGHLTVIELADHIGVDAAKVHRWIERRQLPSYKRNNLRYVVLTEFDAWALSRKVQVPSLDRQLTLL
jgi:hypothetical protein